MKRVVSFALLSLLMVSCASLTPGIRGKMLTKGITTRYDDFTGNSITTLNLPLGGFKYMAEISVGFDYVESNAGKALRMYSFLYKSGWLFTESILFNVDGKIYRFDSSSEHREIASGPYVQELNYYYSVNNSLLELLRDAKSVKIRIEGRDHYLDPDFPKDDQPLVGDFLQRISSK